MVECAPSDTSRSLERLEKHKERSPLELKAFFIENAAQG
jgi:hypothetical protein